MSSVETTPSFVVPSISTSSFEDLAPETKSPEEESDPSQYVMKRVEERKPYDFVLYGDDDNHEMDDETIAALVLGEINAARENPRGTNRDTFAGWVVS